MSDVAPDYGLYMKSKGLKKDAEVIFDPFQMFHIAKMSDSTYTMTSNTVEEGKEYAMSIDFDQKILNDILRMLPEDKAIPIQDAMEHKAKLYQLVEFPEPIEFGITVKLGELQQNDYEKFIPFIAVKVYKSDPASLI